MKTYVVKDEDGKVVTVNEYEEGEQPEEGEKPAAPAKPEEGAKDEAFTPEQLDAIKQIVAEALAEALKKEEPAPEAPEAEAHDEDVDAAKEENGEGGAIGNVDAPAKAGDSVSKTGPGSVEQKPTTVTDSSINEEEVNTAWENRFKK